MFSAEVLILLTIFFCYFLRKKGKKLANLYGPLPICNNLYLYCFFFEIQKMVVATIIPNKVFSGFLASFSRFATVFTNFVPELACVHLITKIDNMLRSLNTHC
jgi:hypothetical protein